VIVAGFLEMFAKVIVGGFGDVGQGDCRWFWGGWPR